MGEVTDRPMLFLDVDGVLNPYNYEPMPHGYETIRDGPEPLTLNREHGQWIEELAVHLDIVWATAWQDEANEVIAPALRITRLPYVVMPPVPFPPDAKVARIEAFAERAAARLDR
jgi:hypothetical protein